MTQPRADLGALAMQAVRDWPADPADAAERAERIEAAIARHLPPDDDDDGLPEPILARAT